ncbi:hypothetical protein OIDMADRAFT_60573 [Oidiodendron maius Zn]|uniref:Uncharacterized protein n=1 Tax=Oidiodendron maius (strain Zn) TaxID=913774 RepID=A0A0C3GU27_OIDMZ|nr:hypothetical protein OIDMADRAFT_60573 [Oidiodendron maius Zn]
MSDSLICSRFTTRRPFLGDHCGSLYILNLTNPTSSQGDLFTPNIAHGKAALACLRYLVAEKPLSDEKFKLYATTTWRWHLIASMGIRERQFAEPLSALEDGKSLPDDLSREIIVALYIFLTASKVDPWLEHWFLNKRLYDKLLFKEIYHYCIELSAWYRANKQHLEDRAAFETQIISTECLISWCEGLTDLQCVADHLWRRACHVWMWNSWKACQQVIAGYEQLVEIGIWVNHPDVVVPNDEATQLLKEEEAIVEANVKVGVLSKRSGKLFGNLNLRYAIFYLILQKERGSQRRFDAVIKAGDVDNMFGVCQANMSTALRFISSRVGFEESDEKKVLSEAMIFIQDAIDEDSRNPRNYEQLGHLYDQEGKKEGALKAWKTGLALDTNGKTCCGEEYYQQKVWSLTRDDVGSATPDYEGVIAVLEEAIKYAPAFSNSRWYHQMADIWNSLWDDLAETYIDHELFEETRQFNWRAYCNVLTEATTFDPSGAHSHFHSWVTKAKDLKEYQYFELAIEILERGIETTSQTKTKAAIEARANFEFALGETFCAMTRWEDAVSPLEDSSTTTPPSPRSTAAPQPAYPTPL